MALDGAAGSRRLARRVAPIRGKTSPQVGINRVRADSCEQIVRAGSGWRASPARILPDMSPVQVRTVHHRCPPASPTLAGTFPSTSVDGAASRRRRRAATLDTTSYPGNTRTGASDASAERRPRLRGRPWRPSRRRAVRPQPRMTAAPASMTTPGRCSSGGRPADSESLKPGPDNDPSGNRNSA